MTFLIHPIASIGNRLRRKRDYTRLQDLPEYLLKDIGVTRHDILEALAHGRSSRRAGS